MCLVGSNRPAEHPVDRDIKSIIIVMLACGILLRGCFTDYPLQSKALETYSASGPRCPEQATDIHSAPSVLLACSGLSSARVPSFIHSFMGVCLTDLAIANQKVSFNCIKDGCIITGSRDYRDF